MNLIKHTITSLLLLGVFLVPTVTLAEETETETTSTSSTTTETVDNALVPNLSVDIPGVSFSNVLNSDGVLQVNFLADYISGLYVYLIGFGTTIAIVFVMIGGLQYALGGMGSEQIQKGKQRIRNAVIGLSLLLSIYLILFTINPQTTFLKPLQLVSVEGLTLDAATSGYEGGGGTVSREVCDAIVEEAKSEGTCNISQSVTSPTGSQPNCGNHHWFDGGADGNYEDIKNLDYAAPWDLPILATFDATVTYHQWNSNKCGNEIRMSGRGDAAGAKISICHAKNFIGADGTFQENRTVSQGEVVGHLGGNCCSGENPPANWSAAEREWCDVGGTPCTDPKKDEECDCQDWRQAGNTSGPHVHMTWYASGGDLLACLDY
jgi:murein DD-endopeptidase MepM/ murein hydrolase activator NlpD